MVDLDSAQPGIPTCPSCLKLAKKIVELEGHIQRLEAQLKTVQGIAFGRKSEASIRRLKVRQPSKPPQKRTYSELPVVEERLTVEQSDCPQCGAPMKEMSDAVDGETLEIEVKAYRRRIHRQVLKRACRCKGVATFVKAPFPGKVVPRGVIGASLWVHLLMGKYAWHIPLERLLGQLASEGLGLAQPTVIDGLRHIHKLLSPVYEGICAVNRTEAIWNADETGWYRVEGKKLWLWVFLGRKSCVYRISDSRSAAVIEDHLGEDTEGIIHSDRYKAYQKYAEGKAIDLAFCWAHMRRDFLRLSKQKQDEEWALVILDEIQEIYRLSKDRASAEGDEAFVDGVHAFLSRRERDLAQASGDRQRVLQSVMDHRHGLTTVCVSPEVSLDNNAAERALRGPVVGRKNYWGSKSLWSSELSAMLFSLVETAQMNGLDPKTWLLGYLEACAKNGSRAPEDLAPWMPVREANQQAPPTTIAA